MFALKDYAWFISGGNMEYKKKLNELIKEYTTKANDSVKPVDFEFWRGRAKGIQDTLDIIK